MIGNRTDSNYYCVGLRDRELVIINIMCVFVVRGDRVLALVNNMYVLEGKTKCLHLLYLCVKGKGRSSDCTNNICVCGKSRPRTCNPLYYMCICGKGSPSACICVMCGKGRPSACTH